MPALRACRAERVRHDGGLDNGVCVCPACHLRLIHGGIVEVYRQGPLLVWDYPDRRVAVLLTAYFFCTDNR